MRLYYKRKICLKKKKKNTHGEVRFVHCRVSFLIRLTHINPFCGLVFTTALPNSDISVCVIPTKDNIN